MGNFDWFPTCRCQIVSRVTLDTGGGGRVIDKSVLGGLVLWFWQCGLVQKPWCCGFVLVVLACLDGDAWMECVDSLVDGG